jgi:branched-chain amino acid transport system ATP-binding protein
VNDSSSGNENRSGASAAQPSHARGEAAAVTSPVLETVGLAAAYGRVRALNGVNLRVEQGEAVALIGANGAGKTTFMRTVAGLMTPTAGTVRLAGADVTGKPAEKMVGAGLSMVPEGRQIFSGLSVRDNLTLGAYRRRRSADLGPELAQIYEFFPVLSDRRDQLGGTLSGGEQQMLAIGRGLMARPKILLLDEPSLGLAPLAVREVVSKLQELTARGTTILLVEQNARAAMQIASRGYVLQRGVVVLTGSTEDLLRDPEVKAAYLGGGSSTT